MSSIWRSGEGYFFLLASLIAFCASAAFSYFFVKRSTRPAVSNSFCLPVKKGWQFRTDFDAQQSALDRGASRERVPASAVHRYGMVVRMNIGFHGGLLPSGRSARSPVRAPELQPRRLVSGQFAIIRDSGHSCKARRAGHNKSVARNADRRMISLGCGLYLFTLNPEGEPERMTVRGGENVLEY